MRSFAARRSGAPERPRGLLVRLNVSAGIFLALHILVALIPSLRLWGVDAAAYASGMTWLFAVAGALLFLPPIQKSALMILPALGDRVWVCYLLPVVFGCLFYVFPVSRHFLGDGELLLRTLRAGVPEGTWAGINAPLAFTLINKLNRLIAPETAARVISMSAGILYVALVTLLPRRLFQAPTERGILIAFALTPGFLQLFFGYVEMYPVIFPILAAYVLLGWIALEGRCPVWLVAAAAGVLFATHFVLATFIPSLALLLWLRGSASGKYARTILEALTCPVVALGVLYVVSFNLGVYTSSLRESYFLPFFGEGHNYPFGILSFGHVNNVLNQILLVTPAALIVLLLRPKAWLQRHPVALFLGSAALFPFAFTVLANPEIGAFRDWDAFSFPAFPILTFAAYVVIHVLPKTERVRVTTVCCGASLIHTGFWIALNAQLLAEVRYTTLLQTQNLSTYARAFGWETFGQFHRRNGDAVRERNAFLKAAEANPRHARYWNSLGTIDLRQGNVSSALKFHQKALELNPNMVEAKVNIAGALHRMKQYEQAIPYYESALDQDPGLFAEIYLNYGKALLRVGRCEESLKAYQTSIERDPAFYVAHFAAGTAADRIGDTETARRHYEEVLRLHPRFPYADQIKQWLAEQPPP